MNTSKRDNLISAFELPRALVKRGLIPSDCLFEGVYRETATCKYCFEKQSCQWLADNDCLTILQAKTDEQLVQAIHIAKELITVHVLQQEHEPGTCRCEPCVWLRKTDEFTA